MVSRCSAVVLVVAIFGDVEVAVLQACRSERLVDVLIYPVDASLIVLGGDFHTLAARQRDFHVRVIHPLAVGAHKLSRLLGHAVGLLPQ